MEHKQENEMDEWMEKMSLCMTRERLDEIQRIATEGMDAWMVRRRRRDRATLAAVFASVAVTAVAAGWLLLPRQRAQDTLTACEPPQPGIRVAAVERVPATLPAPPAPIPAKPAPVRKGEEEKPQAATAAVPPAVREEPFRYGELVCNNSCDPDSVISRICFHCGGEEVYHG